MTTALAVSVLLLLANAFFVAAEFALVASKRHRLEDLAERGSIAARAAVRGSRELSLMLAGAQLGITLCTLALGSLAKPAVAEVLAPLLTFLRVPDPAAYVIAVVVPRREGAVSALCSPAAGHARTGAPRAGA